MRTTVPDASSSKDKEQFTLWTPNLAHYATYTERELLPAAGYMLRYVLQPIRHESFYRKWAGKRNMKVRPGRVALASFSSRFRDAPPTPFPPPQSPSFPSLPSSLTSSPPILTRPFFSQVSVYMREWALSRWDEGAKVDLAAELPELKREFRELGRARREREEKEAQAEARETSVEEGEC
ncbi:hypothetical protein MVEN_01660800 [Mycena venus]|uniref:Uncharacterized protein n=1 Tax=Mycena venus TaxID=2733690 RepID=A0A8H7CQY6_9AGAR|nr:hypothetical protein MVEN_01660800 [Mycena venus]